MNMNIWYIISYVLLGLSLICFSISIYLYYKYKYKNNKIVKGRVSTKDLFQQFNPNLNREQCWDKAVQLGWKFNILEGVWVK